MKVLHGPNLKLYFLLQVGAVGTMGYGHIDRITSLGFVRFQKKWGLKMTDTAR